MELKWVDAIRQALLDSDGKATEDEILEIIKSKNYRNFDNAQTPDRSLNYYLHQEMKNIAQKNGKYWILLNSHDELQATNGTRKFYKISPGEDASQWGEFYRGGFIAINFGEINCGDLSKFNSWDELNHSVGLTKMSNKSMNLWDFKSAQAGDIVFVNHGVNKCIGIGIIEGEYYYEDTAEKFKHRRRIHWITDKAYEYTPYTLKDYKVLFRPDTFTKTHVKDFLLREYSKKHPELASVFESLNLKSETIVELSENFAQNHDGINYWWMNANPAIWEIDHYKVGQRQTYTTHNSENNKRRIYKHFETVSPGDLMIGYESSPSRQIKAIYKITDGIRIRNEKEEIEFELIKKFEHPVHWDEIKNIPALQHCEVIINNQGSLFHLTENEYTIIKDIIEKKNGISSENISKKIPYDFTNDSDKPFISEADFHQAVSLLKRKKNIILQGPPGVGKTFIARKLAYQIMNEVSDANIEMIQFHQSYSYEDFIQGLRPTLNGGFDLRNGVFYSFCLKAINNPDKPYFFIIDEINRGNLSKVFGELMMLIEADKRREKFSLKLTYAVDDDDRFYVPGNLYIIGTMNTADRSLAIVDYALRRRFAFFSLYPDYGDRFKSFLSDRGVSNNLVHHICSSVSKVNEKIVSDNNLGYGFQIGHSYFCSFAANEDENKWWSDILHFEIGPLLDEIWFDDLTKAREMIKILSN